MLMFYFGAMGSGKSAYALMTLYQRHQPDAQSHPQTALLATTLDRTDTAVTSRTGMTGPAIQLVPGEVRADLFDGADTVLIDEAQFLTPADIDVLVELSNAGREVICFGLRTDFQGQLFLGAARLFERADVVRQIALEPRCDRCDRQAVINVRFIDGALAAAGPQIALDRSDPSAAAHISYRPMCVNCWYDATGRGPATAG